MAKKNLKAMLMKWGTVVLVCLLAFSLTSCGKKKSTGQGVEVQCNGTFGNYTVQVFPSNTSSGLYDVFVIPNGVSNSDLATICAVESNTFAPKTMVTAVGVYDGFEIYAGSLTQQELLTYDVLLIVPFESGTDCVNGTAPLDTACTLPIPGGAISNTGGF